MRTAYFGAERLMGLMGTMQIMRAGMVLCALAGCSDSTTTGPGPGPAAVVGLVAGRVRVAGANEALGGVTLSLGGRTVTANEQGWFSFGEVAPGDGLPLVARHDGYADGVVALSVRAGAITSADVALVRMEAAQPIDTAAGGTITAASGVTVRFPAGALVTADGRAATGAATVALAYLDASSLTMRTAFPGGFTGRRTDGTTVPFESYGVVAVDVRQGTQALSLAPGMSAEVTLPVASAQGPTAPATMPLWSLDAAQARWTEEGTATRQTVAGRDVWVASVPHLSWWNVDLPFQTTCVRACVRTPEGAAVPNVEVVLNGVDYSGSSRAWTGADGCFAADVKRSAQVSVFAQQGLLNTEPRTAATPSTAMLAASNPQACGDLGALTMVQAVAQITLSWGAAPRDLDSHFTGPTPGSPATRFHVYYGGRGDLGQAPFAALDTDDTSSYGPEVITVSRMTAGRYRYSVHNYSGQASGAIERSGATVGLIVPRQGIVRRYDVNATNPNNGNVWRVFDLVVDGAGTVSVEPIRDFAESGAGYNP
jgi:hypothetical protein